MNKLTYVDRDRDEVIYLNDAEMHLETLLATVKSLFAKGIRFIGVETPSVKLYFDNTKDAASRSISGKFRDGITVRQ